MTSETHIVSHGEQPTDAEHARDGAPVNPTASEHMDRDVVQQLLRELQESRESRAEQKEQLTALRAELRKPQPQVSGTAPAPKPTRVKMGAAHELVTAHVRAGETIEGFAERNKVTPEMIYAANAHTIGTNGWGRGHELIIPEEWTEDDDKAERKAEADRATERANA